MPPASDQTRDQQRDQWFRLFRVSRAESPSCSVDSSAAKWPPLVTAEWPNALDDDDVSGHEEYRFSECNFWIVMNRWVLEVNKFIPPAKSAELIPASEQVDDVLYNMASKLIDSGDDNDHTIDSKSDSENENIEIVKYARRRVHPKRDQKDVAFDEDIVFFSSSHSSDCHAMFAPCTPVPFYYPKFPAYAMSLLDEGRRLTISVYTDSSKPSDSELDMWMRTARKVFSFLLSAKIGYIVRSSQYDHLVSKDAYYATYSDIKSTLSGELVKRWVEDTDPRKHVFEDVGIVSWLENLWKSTVDEKIGGTKRIQCIDLGCGNGVLSYLLHMRGYGVAGIDLASRKTWAVLNELAPNLALTKGIIDPRNRGATIRLLQQNLTSDSELWIIGNHSDELTPWIPIFAAWASYPAENLDSADLVTMYRPVNFVAIPCCRHSLAGPKLATSRHLASSATASEADSLRSPRDLQYLQYIRSISETCGFAVEEDALRIPSPKNAVIVGRKRNFDLTDHEAHRSILTAIDQLIADYGGQSFEPRKGPNTTTATNTAVADVAH